MFGVARMHTRYVKLQFSRMKAHINSTTTTTKWSATAKKNLSDCLFFSSCQITYNTTNDGKIGGCEIYFAKVMSLVHAIIADFTEKKKITTNQIDSCDNRTRNAHNFRNANRAILIFVWFYLYLPKFLMHHDNCVCWAMELWLLLFDATEVIAESKSCNVLHHSMRFTFLTFHDVFTILDSRASVTGCCWLIFALERRGTRMEYYIENGTIIDVVDSRN